MTLRTPFVAAALIALAAPPSAPAATPRQDFRWSGVLAAGQRVEVKGVIGSIRAEPSSGREVVVTAVRGSGERGRAEDLRVEAVPHANGVTICAIYPSPDGRANRCTPGDEWSSNSQDNDARVEFTVRVPRGVNFLGTTVNGSVEALSMPADADASTVNGNVRVGAAGRITGSTINGSIHAEQASTSGDVSLKNLNGNVTLQLPAGYGGRVRANASHGEVESEFPLTIERGRIMGASAEGVIGGGGRTVRLETMNGKIRILRQGGRAAGTANVRRGDDGEVIVRPPSGARPSSTVQQGAQGDFRWAGALAAGERVEIRGIHGSIRAEPTSGREVEVTAVRRTGRRGSAEDVRIEAVRHASGVTVCALYTRMRQAPQRCDPDDDRDGSNDGSSDVRVEWVVRVPRGVHFEGETLNGNVEARSMTGNATVSTVNGEVTVSAAGEIDASTVNGPIRATAESATPRALRFHSVNGSIVVQLPASFGARVRASSFNSGIQSDFPLNVRS
ncbi:MAG TPA: hypothetical protein VK420_04945, partial [Longimicrobium sp.]|nr:hypothetical protein [Longimicrobium sp.]